ncbi:MAG TPA: glycosyltransferase family 39 protein [Solirubrobacteraceae bacterium]|nr:glycosyltransferase family 39 protein [Solirubrobacteraceae bacterium]
MLPAAAAVTLVLAAFASGYGYHRDELYFVAAGRRLAWAYADQGPVTPFIARAMSEIAPGSLTVLRSPSAIAAGLVVLLTGVLARELGGGRRAQSIAAACAAVAAVVLFTGHTLSTSTFDLLVWTTVSWLAVRAVRTGDERLWLAAGAVLGAGLLNKPLPAFLAAGLLAGAVLAGPRRLLRTPPVWAGAALALALWLPWIVWQARHGWPQIDVSRSIAAGESASSQPWWAIVPFQFLLVSPLLAPVWIAGLIRLLRDPALRRFRFIAWAWIVLAVVFMATGGKPYYLAGLLPVLLAAGALSVDGWLGRHRIRRALLVAAIAVSAVVDAVIALPVLPAADAGPVVAANADVGETIGWPEFARTVAGVAGRLPRGAVILTRNYGEAGAIDRYGPALGLGRAYSGHNAYGDWGPPPDGAGPVIAVGLHPAEAAHLRGCRAAARIDNRAGIDNDERGTVVLVCSGPRRPWSREWPALRHLG